MVETETESKGKTSTATQGRVVTTQHNTTPHKRSSTESSSPMKTAVDRRNGADTDPLATFDKNIPDVSKFSS